MRRQIFAAFTVTSVEPTISCNALATRKKHSHVGESETDARRFWFDYLFIFLVLLECLFFRIDVSFLRWLSRLCILTHVLQRCIADFSSAYSCRTPSTHPVKPSPAYAAGLTAREIEVLHLVAQGLTDIQMAKQLVISPRTVNWHLTTIYSKIQVSSRCAATRYAIEHKLV